MNFGEALELLKKGKKLARNGWNGKGMFAKAQFPDSGSMNTHPYITMHIPECEEGLRILPWQPSQVDLFTEDWEIVE